MDVIIRRLPQDEVAVRCSELGERLAEWVSGSVSGSGLPDLRSRMRFAVSTAARHPEHAVLLAVATRSGPGAAPDTAPHDAPHDAPGDAPDDALIGILVGESRDGSRDTYGFIEWIAVAPDARRRGVGAALVAEFAATSGVERLEGSVNIHDPVAMAFWERQGWTRLRPPPRRVMMGGPVRQGAVSPQAPRASQAMSVPTQVATPTVTSVTMLNTGMTTR